MSQETTLLQLCLVRSYAMAPEGMARLAARHCWPWQINLLEQQVRPEALLVDELDFIARATHLVFVSPFAVQAAFQLASQFLAQSNAMMAAVGPATASALQKLMPAAALLTPPAGLEGAEALWQNLAPTLSANAQVAIFAAPDGSSWLLERLKQVGTPAQHLMVYRRQRRALDQSTTARLQGFSGCIQFASAAQLQAFLVLRPLHLADLLAIVPSERVAHVANQHGFGAIHMIPASDDGKLIDFLLTYQHPK